MSIEPMAPFVEDRDTGPYFQAAAEGRLVYCACDDCGHALHPPTAYCRHCGSWNTDWREAKGTGVVHTWTTVTHQIHPAYPTPYTVVVVELDDAPEVRLLGLLPGQPELSPGLPMKVWFQTLEDGPTLPQWKPA